MASRLSPGTRNILLAILVLAFALRLAGIGFGWPWLTQYDEGEELVKPALKALDFATTHGVAPVTHNGPLCKYLLAFFFGLWGLGAALFGSTANLVQLLRETTAAVIVARVIIGVLAGTAGVWVVWQAGRRFAGDVAGLGAAFFLAVAFKPVEFSHYATSDTMAALAVSLVLLFTLRYHDTGSFRDLALAGILWAAGVAIKLSLAPVAVLPLAGILTQSRLSVSARVKAGLKVTGIGVAAVLLLHLPYLANPRPYLVAITDLMLTAVAFFHKGFFWYFYPHVYPTIEIPTAGVGWLWLSFALIGMVLSLRLPGRKKWIVLPFALVFYLVLGTSKIKLTRYFLPLLPVLAIWAGVTLAWLKDFLQDRLPQVSRRVIVVAVTVLFSGFNLYHSVLFGLQAAGPNTVFESQRYLSQNLSDSDHAYLVTDVPINDSHIVNSTGGFISKRNLQDGVRREVVKEHPLLKDLVGSGSNSQGPARSALAMPPDSLHLVKGINVIILDEYRVRDITGIPEKYVLDPQEFRQGRAFIEAVRSRWKLIGTITPRYRQDWGESCAGRQPTVWVYRWPDEATAMPTASSAEIP